MGENYWSKSLRKRVRLKVHVGELTTDKGRHISSLDTLITRHSRKNGGSYGDARS